MKAIVQRRRAFMADPDAPNPNNPIHSTDSARARGFKGALVGGATVYGWAVAAIVESLGETWLDHGWAEVRFRHPVYPTDELTVDLAADGALFVSVGETRCVEGRVGPGDAPWLDELMLPEQPSPEAAADPRPRLTPANVPIGKALRTREVRISQAEAEDFCRNKQDESSPLFFGSAARLHPAWIASQPIYLLHHSFDYGPAIHTASRIAHLRRMRVDQPIIVAGVCKSAFARNGNDYIVNDTVLRDPGGNPLVRIEHTAIYQLGNKR